MINLADLKDCDFTAPWYVALPLPGQDKRAKDCLVHRGYQPYRPIIPTLRRQGRGVVKPTSKSMFPGYVFVRDVMGQGWEWLHRISAIHRLWVFNGRLATLDDDDVQQIRQTEERIWKQQLETKRLGDFTIGQVLPVQSGAFAGFLAEIETLDDAGRVGVLIEILGRQTRISMPPEHLLSA
jgi:transcriptional antiterminator RfaH